MKKWTDHCKMQQLYINIDIQVSIQTDDTVLIEETIQRSNIPHKITVIKAI